jgi:hypothetical protein
VGLQLQLGQGLAPWAAGQSRSTTCLDVPPLLLLLLLLLLLVLLLVLLLLVVLLALILKPAAAQVEEVHTLHRMLFILLPRLLVLVLV